MSSGGAHRPPMLVTKLALLVLMLLASADLALTSQCQEIHESVCQHPSLPYNMTVMPNAQGHRTQTEAAAAMREALSAVPADDGRCDIAIRMFFCMVYFPVCTILEGPVPPCRQLCQKMRDMCAPGADQWPKELPCDQLPDDGGDVLCLGETGMAGTATATAEASVSLAGPSTATTESSSTSTDQSSTSTARPPASTPGTATSSAGSWSTTTTPWDTTTRPWRSTTKPWNTTTKTWRSTTKPWNTTTQPWRSTTKPWNTTTQPWRSTTKPWNTTTQPWRSTTKPWNTTTQPWRSTTKPWNTTTKPWRGSTRPWNSGTRGWYTGTRPWHTTSKPRGSTTRPWNTGTRPWHTTTKPRGSTTSSGNPFSSISDGSTGKPSVPFPSLAGLSDLLTKASAGQSCPCSSTEGGELPAPVQLLMFGLLGHVETIAELQEKKMKLEQQKLVLEIQLLEKQLLKE